MDANYAVATARSQNEIELELSIVMPCLNEAETLAICIEKAKNSIKQLGLEGEVIIADNGSTDGSVEIALNAGARVVHVTEKGYGNALLGGITAAQGKYVIMGDADDSYDFTNLGPFIEKLREGYDLVMGNRFKGGIKPGAMPPLHKYLGNPVLTWIARLLFRRPPVTDFHCGLRGFSKSAAERMDLQTTGMEFASEMVVKATLHKMLITEVPTILSPDGRSRPPHLRSWRDGWRHLRFLLLYSPRWIFLYPGLLLMMAGAVSISWLTFAPFKIGSIIFDIHTLLYAAMALIVGFQAVLFAVFAKTFAIAEKLLPEDSRINKLHHYINLESSLISGGILVLGGLATTIYSIFYWKSMNFGDLNPQTLMRITIPSVTALVIGTQCIFSGLFLSILRMKRK